MVSIRYVFQLNNYIILLTKCKKSRERLDKSTKLSNFALHKLFHLAHIHNADEVKPMVKRLIIRT